MKDALNPGSSLKLGPQKNLIGPRLRMIRKSIRPKVSQDDLTGRLARLGLTIDRSAISRIENQDRAITDVEIISISRCLHIPIERLFEGFHYQQSSTQDTTLKVAEDPRSNR